jgi:hypothetical protein
LNVQKRIDEIVKLLPLMINRAGCTTIKIMFAETGIAENVKCITVLVIAAV